MGNKGSKRASTKMMGSISLEKKISTQHFNRIKLNSQSGKIYAVSMVEIPDQECVRIATASQEGIIIIWDIPLDSLHLYASKKPGKNYKGAHFRSRTIKLRSAWIMSVALSHDGDFVASGGLDGIVSIFDISGEKSALDSTPVAELGGAEQYISCISWVGSQSIVCGSGDARIRIYNTRRSCIETTFTAAKGDVQCLDLSVTPEGTLEQLLFGSTDGFVYLRDLRDKDLHTAQYHERYTVIPDAPAVQTRTRKTTQTVDINAACFSRNGGDLFAIGNDSSIVQIFSVYATASQIDEDLDISPPKQRYHSVYTRDLAKETGELGSIASITWISDSENEIDAVIATMDVTNAVYITTFRHIATDNAYRNAIISVLNEAQSVLNIDSESIPDDLATIVLLFCGYIINDYSIDTTIDKESKVATIASMDNYSIIEDEANNRPSLLNQGLFVVGGWDGNAELFIPCL